MRRGPGAWVGPAVAAVLLLAGCSASGGGDAATAPGCGLVQRSRVVGLVGGDVRVSAHGSLSGLRDDHRRASCTTAARGQAGRSVRVVATYHPRPYTLPRHSCDSGWVFAGSVQKYAPACQEGAGGHGRTRLVVRWQPYLMTVTVDRPDRNWGGDPELALAMTRDLARRLGVREAAGDG